MFASWTFTIFDFIFHFVGLKWHCIGSERRQHRVGTFFFFNSLAAFPCQCRACVSGKKVSEIFFFFLSKLGWTKHKRGTFYKIYIDINGITPSGMDRIVKVVEVYAVYLTLLCSTSVSVGGTFTSGICKGAFSPNISRSTRLIIKFTQKNK